MAFTTSMLKDKWENLIPTSDKIVDATWAKILADAQEEARVDLGSAPSETVVNEKQLVLWHGAKVIKMNTKLLADAESSPGGSVTFPTMKEINTRINEIRDAIRGVRRTTSGLECF